MEDIPYDNTLPLYFEDTLNKNAPGHHYIVRSQTVSQAAAAEACHRSSAMMLVVCNKADRCRLCLIIEAWRRIYMRVTGSSLVQVMTCRLIGAKPLPEQMLTYHQLDLTNKLQWNLNQISTMFYREIVFVEVVCKLVVILFWSRCVKSSLRDLKWRKPRIW